MPAVGDPRSLGELDLFQGLAPDQLIDLAEIVGASREGVNQVIVDFKHRGFISVDPDYRIRVHDRAELARYCQ
jgi:DNA-binding IclR family transcriptional regulator